MDKVTRNTKNRRLKWVLYLFCIAILIGFVTFVSRGPHVSNILKKLILPELEIALGQKVIAQKIYINIFPLFIEAKGVKVFDEDGRKILLANRVKGYLSLSGLFSRHLTIHRLAIKEFDVSTRREQVDEIVQNIKTYLKKERKPSIKVEIKVVEVVDGVVSFVDKDSKSFINVKGLKSEIVLGKNPRLRVDIKEFNMQREDWPALTGNLHASTVFKKNIMEIKNLEIGSYGTQFKAEGFYQEGKSMLKAQLDLIVDSVKQIFHLKQKGEGIISAHGEIKTESFQRLEDVFIDLKLKGDFYIQALMELLNVKEQVEGSVDFHGEIQGQIPTISGKAKARLRKGNLFGVDIDELICDVTYHDG
ncbi:MAG: AsmA-like C-terminal region-containing protein, partial [Nitrospirota bacterium]|nr:AsmA-like C-terminal region-containing protein [Nitrospirota bacterium]